MDKYDPIAIEKKWRERWEKTGIYKPDLDRAKKPFFNLMMFPYPSAEGLHVGSVFTFTGVDTYGRFKRMQGYQVFEPMGLDGFGIHSENYALLVGRHPKEQAKISEKNFYRQLRSIGNSFDWSRKLETYDPLYYKWTQWIFIEFFKRGLAYRKKSPVNFCPSCKTVLADEQVIDGRCERCQSIVEKRELEQWFFRITKYADRLLANIPKLNWTNKVKIAQKEWIGKKQGINITYDVEGNREEITCFTTRPDTNFGATFIVIGPEYSLIDKITKKEYKDAVKKYIKWATSQSESDRFTAGRKKTGVFTGSYAINNLNGKRLPIWVSDFVLGNVGTGAVVGVPGHDLRDFEFASEFKLSVVRVVVGPDGDTSDITRVEQVQEEAGTMVNSEFLNGLDIHEATKRVMDYIEEKGWGKRVTTYHLRDWLISRQRYWGPPIPMINCAKCHWQPVPEKDLPVLLPDVKDWKPKGTGKSPLASVESFVNTRCPQCGGKAVRETDVSDTFLDSSWYFFRYLATDVKEYPLHRERNKQWLPVTMYIGGAEHSVLHLLYSRFITMVFKDMGLIDFEEPYARFYAHGLIIKDGAKMSKSRGNVVNPDEYLRKYGADTLRCYLRFVGSFDMGGDFRDTGIEGMRRFLKRVWNLFARGPVRSFPPASARSKMSASATKSLRAVGNPSTSTTPRLRIVHKTIKGVTEDLENLKFNTAIAKIMEYVNHLNKQSEISSKELEVLLLLLAPFAPHMTEELWSILGNSFSIHLQPWPSYDPKKLEEEEVTIVVQVNGKVRDQLRVESGKLRVKDEVEELAKGREKIKRYIEGKIVKKVIYVPGKIINFVVAG